MLEQVKQLPVHGKPHACRPRVCCCTLQLDYAANLKSNGKRRHLILRKDKELADYPVLQAEAL